MAKGPKCGKPLLGSSGSVAEPAGVTCSVCDWFADPWPRLSEQQRQWWDRYDEALMQVLDQMPDYPEVSDG